MAMFLYPTFCRIHATTNKSSIQLTIGSRPSDHYFRSVCLFVQSFFSAVFDPIWITLGYMLHVWV